MNNTATLNNVIRTLNKHFSLSVPRALALIRNREKHIVRGMFSGQSALYVAHTMLQEIQPVGRMLMGVRQKQR